MSDKGSIQLLNLTHWMDDEISNQQGDDSFSQTITRLIEQLHKNRKKLNDDFITKFNEFELTQRFGEKKRQTNYYYYDETMDLVNEIGQRLETLGKIRYLKQRKNSYNLQLIIRMALYWNNPPK